MDEPRVSTDPASEPGTTGLLELTPAETVERVLALGGKAFQAKSLRRHVLERGVLDYEAMTDLSKGLRERLSRELPILRGQERDSVSAGDGAVKLLLGFPERRGIAGSVEVVHLPSRRKSGAATLCVSTQVGCPVRCPFCASGRDGLDRSLTGGEILEQFVRGRAIGPVDRAVIMGIGEPLLNYPALEHALDAVHDEMGLGTRRVTVSTVGFPDRLRALAPKRPRFQLAISLHTPFDEQRDELVPAMAGTPVEDILAAGDDWFEQTGREITYEYVLLGQENDTPEHADGLIRRLRGRRCSVNLIPYNPTEKDPWRRPDGERAEAFRAALEEGGLVATVRWSKGLGADAACGQLRQRHATS